MSYADDGIAESDGAVPQDAARSQSESGPLGFNLTDRQSQNMPVTARAPTDKWVKAHLSFQDAMLHHSFRAACLQGHSVLLAEHDSRNK